MWCSDVEFKRREGRFADWCLRTQAQPGKRVVHRQHHHAGRHHARRQSGAVNEAWMSRLLALHTSWCLEPAGL